MASGNGGVADQALARDSDAAERRRLIEEYLPLVRRIARRFAGGDETLEDLVQVGSLALVKAIDRRDPGRSSLLTAYVSRCIEGEIRRHLRDRSGVVRVPRHLQQSGEDAHGERVPRQPTARGWEDGEAERTASGDDLDGVALARALVSSGARSLEGHERRILLLRYFLDLSQAEVGRLEGVSQVQVSRVQRRALAKMRARLAAGGSPPRLSRPAPRRYPLAHDDGRTPAGGEASGAAVPDRSRAEG